MSGTVFHDIHAELAANFALVLHGLNHWAKVGSHAVRLAATGDGDAEVCRWFAAFHDAARESEGDNTSHGARSAALVQQYRPRLHLTDAQVDVLALACHAHELGNVTDNPTIGVCWDADRLELVRVGMRPRAELMGTAAGRAAARNHRPQ